MAGPTLIRQSLGAGLLLLALAWPSAAAIVRVGGTTADCTGTGFLCAVSYTPTANNLVVLTAACGDSTCVVTVDDNAPGGSSPYTTVVSQAVREGFIIAYAPQVKAGVTTITVHLTLQRPTSVALAEYSGLAAPNPFAAVSAVASGLGTALLSNGVATSQPSSLLIGVPYQDSSVVATFTAGPGYGNLLQVTNAVQGHTVALEDQLVTSTGTYTASATSSSESTWFMWVVAFSGPAAPVIPQKRSSLWFQ